MGNCCKCCLGPLRAWTAGAEGRTARRLQALEPLQQLPTFSGDKKDPGGSLQGPSNSVDGLVLRVAFPLSKEDHGAAHQEHHHGGAQCHSRDGDDEGGEGVLGGLPEAQQSRPAGGNATNQPWRWGSAVSPRVEYLGLSTPIGSDRDFLSGSHMGQDRVSQNGRGVRECVNKLQNSLLQDHRKTQTFERR